MLGGICKVSLKAQNILKMLSRDIFAEVDHAVLWVSKAKTL